MLIGYARVSTQDQNLTPQIEALRGAGCDRIFSDKASGAAATRAGPADALSHARAGDVLMVWKLDRLGRSMKGLVELSADLEEREVGLRSITEGIDTSGSAGRLVFHIVAAMAQMERDLLRERTTAALYAARCAERVGGAQAIHDPQRIVAAKRLFGTGIKAREVAPAIGVSIATLYRHIAAGEQEALAVDSPAKYRIRSVERENRFVANLIRRRRPQFRRTGYRPYSSLAFKSQHAG